MNRLEIKNAAKQQIKGNIGILFVIMIIITAIILATGKIFEIVPLGLGSTAASILIAPPFSLSLAIIYLNLINKAQKPTVSDTFIGFYDFWCAFKLELLNMVFILLWSLLFIVPGIVKSLSYSMSIYILAENKGMDGLEAINRSKQMMNGHKMDLFVLELSFIGWALVGIITAGIGFIWIVPYMQATYVNFYNKIKPTEENIKSAEENSALQETTTEQDNQE